MATAAQWLAGARPRTLPVAVAPVVVGTGAAAAASSVVAWRAGAALVVALALQVGVNYANDYSDGVRGTDDERVGPFRLVGSRAARPEAVRVAALGAFAVAGLAGLALAAATSWWLLAVGAAAILAAWGYTGGPRPYGYTGLGELFVFVFFGLVAVGGTTYVQVGRVTGPSWVGGVATGLLACAVLLANNLRDIPTDTAAGKHTLAVRVGAPATRRLYVAALVVPFLLVIALAVGGHPGALLALLAAPLAVGPVRAVRRGAGGRELIPVLAGTGRLVLAFGLTLGVGLALH
jgi:1,4-dihydroxy-2-naphthoate octaprenyltransferase